MPSLEDARSESKDLVMYFEMGQESFFGLYAILIGKLSQTPRSVMLAIAKRNKRLQVEVQPF